MITSSDFDVNDWKCSGQLKKFGDAELHELLDENLAQSTPELVKILEVDQIIVIKRSYLTKKILKERKWLPHELSKTEIPQN